MSDRTAFLFPGQGRTPQAFPPTIETLTPLLELAKGAGLMLEDWIAAGNDARLTRTDAAQPALLLDGLCRDRMLRQAGWTPVCVAGHSLGEYAALVSARVLRPEDAMRAVIERGRLMEPVRGAMAAVLKLDLDTVAKLCVGTQAIVANHNAPTQIVISGPNDDVQEVARRAEDAGGRSIPLNVSGPFHSPLMLPAQETLSPLLRAIDFGAPAIPVISSVSGDAETDISTLRELLCSQMSAPVRWVDVTRTLEHVNVDTAIEVGSGDVLTRLGTRSGAPIRFLTFQEAMNERL